MKLIKILAVGLLACAGAVELRAGKAAQVYPGKDWASEKPEQVGLDAKKLRELSDYAGGFGCVVRRGYMVYTWGDAGRRKDVASAAKPLYAHFLFKALEDGKISSLDERAGKWEPGLDHINERLGYKDRNITWRHLANQISCYGLGEAPGTAYAYNDWQMALFWDTLFKKVYGANFETVDADVFGPVLTDQIQCQDNPTFMAFGVKDRPGRLAISPRDFARFGLLYLRKGRWRDTQLISREHATMAVASPLPNSIPRAAKRAAEMIPQQRSIGSKNIPDNQCDHVGSYSWLWWTNGVARDGARHWPDVPTDAYGCFGHGGPRAMVVVPSLDLIVSWNDAKIRSAEMENHALGLLVQAASSRPGNTRGKRGDFGSRAGVMWDCTEWSVKNVSHSGDPFDVLATATFSHAATGQKRTTEMFYDGDDTWRLRFTGTRGGKWTFKTSSNVPELDGHTGTVTVTANPNRNVKGFLTHVGNKYAIQVTDDTDLRGYLFDLHEWTNTGQLNAWAAYLHEHFGWQHLLCARGHVLRGPHNLNSYDGFGRNVALTATAHGPADYQEIAEDMDGDSARPHLYEERHSYKRSGFNLDMDGTRRLLWSEAMAGGMGGFYGFYPDSPYPYPNPQQLRTHYTFWHTNNRFRLDMQRANHLGKGSYVLAVRSKESFVFYDEDTLSIRMDLSGMPGEQRAIAVDTKKEYKEIEIAALSAKEHVWKVPYRSDWAIAVGFALRMGTTHE